MHKVLLFCSLLALPACYGGSQPGTMWGFSDYAAEYYGDEELTTARLQCAQGGYDGAGFDACVQNSMRY